MTDPSNIDAADIDADSTPATATWDAPVPMPAEGGPWGWDESTLSWVEFST